MSIVLESVRKVTKIKVEGTMSRKDQFTLTSQILYSFESDTVLDWTKDFHMDVLFGISSAKRRKANQQQTMS